MVEANDEMTWAIENKEIMHKDSGMWLTWNQFLYAAREYSQPEPVKQPVEWCTTTSAVSAVFRLSSQCSRSGHGWELDVSGLPSPAVPVLTRRRLPCCAGRFECRTTRTISATPMAAVTPMAAGSAPATMVMAIAASSTSTSHARTCTPPR